MTMANNTRAICFDVQCGGIGPNPSYRDQMVGAEEIRRKYGEEAGNAYDDLLAARKNLRRVYEKIRQGHI